MTATTYPITVHKTQEQMVREHLEAGKTITPGTALMVYGISRLAVAICRLRASGMKIDMTVREDEAGHKYGEYRLAGAIRIGSYVQVKAGHGYGLPDWIRKTAQSKVTGLLKDVAYVNFRQGDRQATLPLNVKELACVA